MDGLTTPDQLETEYEALLAFLYLCPAGLLQIDASGTVHLINPSAVQMLLPHLAVPTVDNLFDSVERYAPEIRNLARGFNQPRGTICENHRIHVNHAADKPVVFSCTMLKIRHDCIMVVLNDVSSQVAQERRLHQAESWFGTLLGGVHDFVLFSLDGDGKVDEWNSAAHNYTGYSEGEILGRTLQHFYGADPLCRDKAARQLECARKEGWAVEEGYRHGRDGCRTWMQSLVAAVRPTGNGSYRFSVVMRDITERKMSTDDLRRLLTTDHLTGAKNRAHLFNVAEVEVARWKRHGTPLSAILLDGDHFKQINDTYGHLAGDAVLRTIAERCGGDLREIDTLARFGGEEFVVLLPGLDVDEAAAVAERLRGLVAQQPVTFDGTPISVTLSLGCASMNARTETLEALLASADAAAYRAKRLGRNRVEIHRPEPEGSLCTERALVQDRVG